MTQLVQLLKPLPDFPGSTIFELTLKGDLWYLESTSDPDHCFCAIESRILRQKYGLNEYLAEIPDEALKAMATSARQSKLLVVVDTTKLKAADDASTVTVNLRKPIVVNGATLHAYPIELEDWEESLELQRLV